MTRSLFITVVRKDLSAGINTVKAVFHRVLTYILSRGTGKPVPAVYAVFHRAVVKLGGF